MKTRIILIMALLIAAAGPSFGAQVAKTVSFSTEDGVTIVGTYYEGTGLRPGIVLQPMLSRTRADWTALAFELQGKGYHVLAIDHRGHGDSTKTQAGGAVSYKSFTQADWLKLPLDTAAATAWLAQHEGVDRERLAVIGASIGANAALVFAAQKKTPVKTLVLLSPGEEYHGLRTPEAARSYKRPILLVAAQGDEGSAKSVAALAIAAADGSAKKILSGSAHGTKMFDESPDLRGLIVGWLAKNLD